MAGDLPNRTTKKQMRHALRIPIILLSLITAQTKELCVYMISDDLTNKVNCDGFKKLAES